MIYKTLHSMLPNLEDLLALEPEDLAGFLMECFNSVPGIHLSPQIIAHPQTLQDYPVYDREKIAPAIMEAWAWLVREGLVVPSPGDPGNYFISRRGKKLKNATDVDAYQNTNLLPKRILHPVIAQKVWANFLRGDYDTAVFQAFKEVEVGVRTAGGFPATLVGVPLMQQAFNSDNGPLTDMSVVAGERTARMQLFAGAIGSYKNPQSHRTVGLDATEAVELITLASHLLKIVDARSSIAPTP